MDDDLRERPGVVSRFFHSLEVKYQYYLDKLTPQTTVRWLMAVVAIITFCARILYLQVRHLRKNCSGSADSMSFRALFPSLVFFPCARVNS
ncbi:hypothetical protein TELCIR_13686 [Teladorsagia circumcincta]|uniref:Uncharacterized protein n=1 Tax=Teladorsagia circumcincta TaxID=45464 RepID=A0A2G9U3B6_TELCI|nr:hypothetical protein TELCIR_13686 [Teladorsagia circumcincta]